MHLVRSIYSISINQACGVLSLSLQQKPYNIVFESVQLVRSISSISNRPSGLYLSLSLSLSLSIKVVLVKFTRPICVHRSKSLIEGTILKNGPHLGRIWCIRFIVESRGPQQCAIFVLGLAWWICWLIDHGQGLGCVPSWCQGQCWWSFQYQYVRTGAH